VIDGGANIGFMTMIMSRLVGAQGHVEAFEPATVNFKKLRKNLELNKVENVTAINRALWRSDEQLTLHIAHDTGLCCLRPLDFELMTLPVGGLTLDRWCMNYEQAPRLLKLDIEGAEEDALVGARAMLERGIDFVICECNVVALDRFGSSQRDLRTCMERWGYEMFLMHENGDEPELVSEDRLVEGPENLNVLFSKPDIVRRAWEESLS
jgi:FkbM family methyltransferase